MNDTPLGSEVEQNKVKFCLKALCLTMPFQTAYNVNWSPSISGDIFGVTYMAYRWKISGVSYESHCYEIESHRLAEFII